jgi:dienelactone hydrolase
MRHFLILIAPLVLLFSSGLSHADACHVGAYRLADGRALDISPAADEALRWRMEDGSSGKLAREGGDSTQGWTNRADGHRVNLGACESGALSFDGKPGQRIPLQVTEVRFAVDGAELAGRLIMPAGNDRVPVVVLVHGSEASSARDFFPLQRQLPAAGIGAFVYDKRGTGGSTGTFTHDYHQLAADVVAAVKEARRLAGRRATKIGLHGGSQGGWVALLAASRAKVDFVIVAYGLAVSPLDEDREAVALDMARHGFGAEETRKALAVARAAEAIITSGFQSGYPQLEALRARYSAEPWFRYLRGNVTGLLLAEPESFWREQGPVLLAGILRILGADDIDAPPQETWRRLLALKRAGMPLSLAMLARAEHGLYEYELNAKGERVSLGLARQYFPLMRDYILAGEIATRYDGAVIVR